MDNNDRTNDAIGPKSDELALMKKYREAARVIVSNGGVVSDDDFMVDEQGADHEVVSPTDDGYGAWVRCWVWVGAEEMQDLNDGREKS